MNIDLEAIGLTQDELQRRVIEAVTEQVMTTRHYDEDGDPWAGDSRFAKQLQQVIQNKIDASVSAIGEKHVIPIIHEKIESLTLQKTNQWGEAIKSEQPLSFTEYLVGAAEKYMTEEVDGNGRTAAECRSHSDSFYKKGTRISAAIDRHLDFHIKQAMEKTMVQANSTIATSLVEAVKTALSTVTTKLSVTVK